MLLRLLARNYLHMGWRVFYSRCRNTSELGSGLLMEIWGSTQGKFNIRSVYLYIPVQNRECFSHCNCKLLGIKPCVFHFVKAQRKFPQAEVGFEAGLRSCGLVAPFPSMAVLSSRYCFLVISRRL